MIRFFSYSVLIASCVCFCSSCLFEKKQQPSSAVDSLETDTVEAEPVYLFNICIDSLCIKEEKIKPNQHLSQIFSSYGISPFLTAKLVQLSKGVFDTRKIAAGKTYIAISSNDTNSVLRYFIYKEDPIHYVGFNFQETLVYKDEKPVAKRKKIVASRIDESLWVTAQKNNTSPLLSIRLSEIYESQIDFFEITPTDSFVVLFDEIYVDDSLLIDIGEVYACVFYHRGKKYESFSFYQDNKLNYFDEKGENLKRAFLKAPLKYSRISSKFTNRRYHPVLKIYRPHHGVDYAAPVGTPVFSIGAGRVCKKGYQKSGGGNFISIKHPNGYKTTYMHLHRFAKGMKVGKTVQQGELIGYVGSTGLSSGPHLDFRIYKNGKPINPLKVISPPLDCLQESLQDSFLQIRTQRLEKLNIKQE